MDFSLIIGFILMIGFIVLVHEFGHFIIAKLLKIKVEEFSLGFGPKIVGLKKGETLYKIAPIPLGGYVKIYGMEEEEITEPEKAFYNRPKIQRFLILVMGGIFNIVSAYFLFTISYMLGVYERTYLDNPPIIGWVNENSPAKIAGLQVGDKIISINNIKMSNWKKAQDYIMINPNQNFVMKIQRKDKLLTIKLKSTKITSHEIGYIGALPVPPFKIIKVSPNMPAQKAGIKPNDIIYEIDDEPMPDDTHVIAAISKKPGKPLLLSISRGNENLKIPITPLNANGRGLIGVLHYPYIEKKSYGIHSFSKAALELWNNTVLIFSVLKKLITGSMSVKSLSGPIELAKFSGSAYKHGFEVFIFMIALISVNLGIINLLPIPMLDGGHIFIMLIEWVIGKEFSIRLKERIATVGLVFLILLMVIVFYFDILKLIQG